MSFIPVNTPLLGGKEKKYLNKCIDTGWISSEGPYVREFENKFSSYVDRKYGVAVSSGSAALDVAVKSLNIGKGDEVIVPTFSIISPISSIVISGAKPVLVDSDINTWNIDVDKIEEKITKKTKAILVVHIYGLPAKMTKIIKLANKYGLYIIEDAAEMHGQTYNGKKCGSFGIVSIFSFYPNKLITTGEGGMIVTNNQNIASRCEKLRNLAFEKRRFVHKELGWNYRMTNLQAALGLAQLEQINKFIKKKRWIGKTYNKLLSSNAKLQLPIEETKYAKNIYWIYGLVLKDNVKMNRNTLLNLLAKKGIGTRTFFWPMHRQPIFIKMGLFKEENYPIADKIAKKGFYIPSGLGIEKKDIETVSKAINGLLNNK